MKSRVESEQCLTLRPLYGVWREYFILFTNLSLRSAFSLKTHIVLEMNPAIFKMYYIESYFKQSKGIVIL